MAGVFRFLGRRKGFASQYNLHEQTHKAWKERARIAAELVAAFSSDHRRSLKVADIGCGDQKFGTELRALLDNIDYHGFDLLPQAPEVRKFDVSKDALGQPFDVAVLLGVLEYVTDVPAVLARLRSDVHHLVVSHSIRDRRRNPRKSMRKLKWKTLMSEAEFSRCLECAGFEITDRRITPDQKTMIWGCQ